MFKYVSIDELVGKVFKEVTASVDEMYFIAETGERYTFYHDQDCCECVSIEDIDGDISDLVCTPITMAEETVMAATEEECSESGTWTYYRFATVRGYVTVRWFGSSNGYYSEGVSFVKC